MNNRTASGAVSACGIRGCSPRQRRGLLFVSPFIPAASGGVFWRQTIKSEARNFIGRGADLPAGRHGFELGLQPGADPPLAENPPSPA